MNGVTQILGYKVVSSGSTLKPSTSTRLWCSHHPRIFSKNVSILPETPPKHLITQQNALIPPLKPIQLPSRTNLTPRPLPPHRQIRNMPLPPISAHISESGNIPLHPPPEIVLDGEFRQGGCELRERVVCQVPQCRAGVNVVLRHYAGEEVEVGGGAFLRGVDGGVGGVAGVWGVGWVDWVGWALGGRRW